MQELHHCGTQVMETERLILRPYTPEDADAMFHNWASSGNVTRYLTWPAHSSVEVSRSVLTAWAQSYQDPRVYHWGIVPKGSGQVIGDIAVVRMDEGAASAELGWCLGEAWWGQGIMPEAALAVRNYLFDRAGFFRLAAKHDVRNPKSGRVMQKIGMHCEGTLPAAGVNNLGICDLKQYAILRDERRAQGCTAADQAAGVCYEK